MIEVVAGSPAERAGLRVDDIVMTVDGNPSGDPRQFRAAALRALEKAEFEIVLLRSGKRETLKVAP